MNEIDNVKKILYEYSSILGFIFFLLCAMLVKVSTKSKRKKKGRKKKGGGPIQWFVDFITSILSSFGRLAVWITENVIGRGGYVSHYSM